MRNITLSIFTAVLIFTAVSCNQNSNQKEETNNSSDTSMNGMNHSKGMSDEAMASAQEKMENKEVYPFRFLVPSREFSSSWNHPFENPREKTKTQKRNQKRQETQCAFFESHFPRHKETAQ